MVPLQGPLPLAYTPAETVPPHHHHQLKQPFPIHPLVLHQATHLPIYSNLAYKMLGTIPAGGDTVVSKTHVAFALVHVTCWGRGDTDTS